MDKATCGTTVVSKKMGKLNCSLIFFLLAMMLSSVDKNLVKKIG